MTKSGWPGSNTEYVFKSFAKDKWENTEPIKKVTLSGSEKEILFELTDAGLKVATSVKTVDPTTIVFLIEM